MSRIPFFPHAAAWAIALLLLGGLALPQICGAHSQSARQSSPQAQSPVAEIVPEDRPDRHGYDEKTFVDEMNHQRAVSAVRAGRRIAAQP